MKRANCLFTAAPSFRADVVGRSAKMASEGTYRVAKVSVKETGKAEKAIVKLPFPGRNRDYSRLLDLTKGIAWHWIRCEVKMTWM